MPLDKIIKNSGILDSVAFIEKVLIFNREYILSKFKENGFVPDRERIKDSMSFIKKMLYIKDPDFSFVRDLYAVTFILPTVEECYFFAEKILKMKGFEIYHKIRDTLESPHKNHRSHRSLDFAMKDNFGAFEVHIRTPELDEIFESTHEEYKTWKDKVVLDNFNNSKEEIFEFLKKIKKYFEEVENSLKSLDGVGLLELQKILCHSKKDFFKWSYKNSSEKFDKILESLKIQV